MTLAGSTTSALLSIFPRKASVSESGHLVLGGCDTVDLVREFGTPLYVYDEDTIRARCREYVHGLRASYPDSLVIYACKALVNVALLKILRDEGLGLDVVSGGEVFAARRAGFPMERVYFHGNNKSATELEEALEAGVGRIVVDNLFELELLSQIAVGRETRAQIMLRVGPGVEAHTHEYRKTGLLDSKFGIPISTGQAVEAVARAMALPGVELVGLHAHVGSQIFELEPYVETIRTVLGFAQEARAAHGLELREFSPGGGWGIAYTEEDDPMPVDTITTTLGCSLKEVAMEVGLPLPRLVIEPGRSIVGSAGVALYTVGSIKDIPGVRRYVAVDGGMADNIRPAIYGSLYRALLANRAAERATDKVTIAGKYCESGDVLIRDALLPPTRSGDIVALPASGAYNLAMSSNYNMALRPAVVMVREGKARLIRRRETYQDLLAAEVFASGE